MELMSIHHFSKLIDLKFLNELQEFLQLKLLVDYWKML